jgi:hypothetical protein
MLLLAIVGCCALFTVRGYTVTPDAMPWSIRAFGNEGFFSLSGFYYNKLLGAYRAFAQTVIR